MALGHTLFSFEVYIDTLIFAHIKLLSILKPTCSKNKHILSIFLSTSIFPKSSVKNSITQNAMVSNRKQHFCMKQSFEKDSHDEQRFEIKPTFSIISGSN